MKNKYIVSLLLCALLSLSAQAGISIITNVTVNEARGEDSVMDRDIDNP